MNYIGSKTSLLNFLGAKICEAIGERAGDESRVFCDLFAGTGAVGSWFKKNNFRVIANDMQYYSYVVNQHYIGNHKPLRFAGLRAEIPALKSAAIDARMQIVCDYLSQLPGRKGFIYANYCFGGTWRSPTPRRYFSDANGMQCDAIRARIEDWRQRGRITQGEYFFLKTSLLESIDKLGNTASVYAAFLKQLKKSARAPLRMAPAELIVNEKSHRVYNCDANALIDKIRCDILYLDPPYNQRQYAANYHILETIAKYDRPRIHGKTGLRDWRAQKSAYCSRPRAIRAFKELVLRAKCKYIFLSYNNEGLMHANDIKSIMQLRGRYACFTKPHPRFQSDRAENRNYKSDKTLEYLHFVACD